MKHKHIEGTGKPLKVVAPKLKKGVYYFTESKEYKVIDCDSVRFPMTGSHMRIKDDNGVSRACLEFYDSHLEGGNWIVTEREATSNTD